MTDLVVKEPAQGREVILANLLARVTTGAFLSSPNQGGPGALAFSAIAQAIILRNMIPLAAELERDTERMAPARHRGPGTGRWAGCKGLVPARLEDLRQPRQGGQRGRAGLSGSPDRPGLAGGFGVL